jgi:hypothetical protein
LGSLVVGDTFLFRGRGSTAGVPDHNAKHVLPVTKPFAYFRSWIQSGEESEAVETLMRTLQSEFMLQSSTVRLGKAIAPLDADLDSSAEGSEAQSNQAMIPSRASILLDSDLLPVVLGSWRIFTGGLVFKSPYFNPIVVSIEKSVKSLTILPSPYEELVLLKMELKEDSNTHTTPVRR